MSNFMFLAALLSFCILNTAGAVENLDLLRDPASKVQAALTTVGFAQPDDSNHLASLGGVFDAPIFVFYKSAERVTQFAQLRGKRLAIGTAGTSRSRKRRRPPHRVRGVAQPSWALLIGTAHLPVWESSSTLTACTP